MNFDLGVLSPAFFTSLHYFCISWFKKLAVLSGLVFDVYFKKSGFIAIVVRFSGENHGTNISSRIKPQVSDVPK